MTGQDALPTTVDKDLTAAAARTPIIGTGGGDVRVRPGRAEVLHLGRHLFVAWRMCFISSGSSTARRKTARARRC